MKRWLLLLLGIFLILLGVSAAGVAGSALAMFGSDESVSTSTTTAHATGAALVVENIRIDASSIPVPRGFGSLRLTASSPTSSSLFIGSSTPANVDTYLTGAPYDVVIDLTSGERVTTRSVPGSQRPSPPESQSIWKAKASGPNPSIPTTAGNKDTIVVMNSDASSGVTADLGVSLTVPGLWRDGWIVMGVGVLSVVLGGLALWRSAVTRRRGKHSSTHNHVEVEPAPESSIAPVPVSTALAIYPQVPFSVPTPAPDPVPTPEVTASAPDLEVAPALEVDPAFVAPWTYVERAAPEPPATLPAVWESSEWIAPETQVAPTAYPGPAPE